MRLEYRIEGMDCADEVAALKRALKDVPDVADLRFDTMNAKMPIRQLMIGGETRPARWGHENA